MDREQDDPITGFDQTNDKVEGLEGDANGFDEETADERRDDVGDDVPVIPPNRPI